MLKKCRKPLALLMAMALMVVMAGCGSKTTNSSTDNGNNSSVNSEQAIKDEGEIVSYGMPDAWANYGEIWKNFTEKYGITHKDTDMTSAEEISKFEAEKNSPVADIGDVGITFGNVAKSRDVALAYKGPNWKDIPSEYKDSDGYWTGEYVGTIAFLVNKKLVQNVPASWADLENPEYKNSVVVGDVLKAAQSQAAVLAAAMANGGDENNIQPGIDYFTKLAKAGNLKPSDNIFSIFQKGEIPIGILWDFNAMGYRAQLDDKDDYVVVIPSDGTVASAYVSVINKYAPHPNAAKAFQDYLLSDEGQVLLAKGYARPIRSDVTIPEDIAKNMVPQDQYKSAKPIKDFAKWEEQMQNIPKLWQDNVQVNM